MEPVNKYPIYFLLLCAGLYLCIIIVPGISGASSVALQSNQGSSNASTDPGNEPDYKTVFSDDIVHEIQITIKPEDWKMMQDDLKSNISQKQGFFNPNMTPPHQEVKPENETAPMMGFGPESPDVDPIYIPATISYNGEQWEHVGVRYKGFNSLQGAIQENCGKISLKLDMDHYEDEYPKTTDQTLFGFSELNLQSNYADSSLIREKIVPEIFAAAGVVAPETAYCQVYVDNGTGPQYFGLFTMVEAVEDTVIKTQYTNSEGNLYKPEGKGATFAQGTLNLSGFNKKTNKKEDNYSDIETLYNVLNSSERIDNPAQWREDLESVLDVSEFLTWLATNTIIQNWDTYGGNSRNYYLYSDPDTGLFSWIPWDNNYALMAQMPKRAGFDDSKRAGFSINGTGMNQSWMFPGFSMENGSERLPGSEFSRAGNETALAPGQHMPIGPDNGAGMGKTLSLSLDEVGSSWPLIRYLMDDPVYKKEYQTSLKEVVTGAFEAESVIAQYQTYHDLIEPYVVGNEGEQAGYTYLTNASDFDAALDELITHTRNRNGAVLDYLKTVGDF
ncbi:MAG TPA: CotH kinase family protein [Methanospirillum sp.]|nr:CotH kinase family protein [Methanospirillum sp.]